MNDAPEQEITQLYILSSKLEVPFQNISQISNEIAYKHKKKNHFINCGLKTFNYLI